MAYTKLPIIGLSAVFLLASGAANAEGNVAKGKAAYDKKCKVCHTTEEGGKAKIGPNLFGIYGRQAGTDPAFVAKGATGYAAFIDSDVVWNDDTLREWLSNPKGWGEKYGVKVKMKSPTKEEDLDNVIAYLKTLK